MQQLATTTTLPKLSSTQAQELISLVNMMVPEKTESLNLQSLSSAPKFAVVLDKEASKKTHAVTKGDTFEASA